MTEIEFAELWFMAAETSYNSHAMLVTSIFAYLLAGHVAGKSIPKGVAVGLSTIVSIYGLTTLASILGSVAHLKTISTNYHQTFPGGFAVPPLEYDLSHLLILTATPTVLIWLGAIYYIHFFVRKHAGA